MQLPSLVRVFLVCAAGATGASSVRAAVASPSSAASAASIVASIVASSAPSSAPSSARSRTLVVLVPGFGGRDFPLGGRYFVGLDEALASGGFDVVMLAPRPVASSEERGAWLAHAIDEAASALNADGQARRVVVIAHSQGGVDVRAALDRGAHVDAVATLSTPHHGTDVAEVALAWPRPLVRAALDAMNSGTASPSSERDAELNAADAALANLTRDGMAAFNAQHPTARVPFFSVAAFSGADVDDACSGGRWSRPRDVDAIHPMLLAGRAMIRWQRHVSDDGVVPTRSMRFGTFLGCVAADHVDWQRWDVERGDIDVDGDVAGELDGARSTASSRRNETFDAHAFIVTLAHGLAEVARSGDAAAMDKHVAALASLAHAQPRSP